MNEKPINKTDHSSDLQTSNKPNQTYNQLHPAHLLLYRIPIEISSKFASSLSRGFNREVLEIKLTESYIDDSVLFQILG